MFSRPVPCSITSDPAICDDSGQVFIFNKRGTIPFIPVMRELTMERVTFDSIDSIIRPIDSSQSECLNERIKCCSYDEATDQILPNLQKYSCDLKYPVDENCSILPIENGLFRMLYSSNTSMPSPNKLILKVKINIYFRIANS